MKRVVQDVREVSVQRRTRAPAVVDATVLDAGSVVVAGDEPVLFYGPASETVDADAERLFAWLKKYDGWECKSHIALTSSPRLSGMRNAHQVFGMTPSVPMRKRFGSRVSTFTLKYPGVTMAMERVGAMCAAMFEAAMPDAYKTHMEAVSAVEPKWLLGGGAVPWTSGIINYSSALLYHKDAANIKGTMSAMFVLRSDGDGGGMLHIPALDLLLPCEDRTVSIFDGCRLLHGVTPLKRQAGTDRFTIVFYAKRQFLSSIPPGDEVRRAQAHATAVAERNVESRTP